ncbi:interferon alpha-inducible protein 27-like protein 1 [Stylophora pistillata]|uniref:Interferon alpha-inducible protein 6 n=1 Tax=Stylophora pistillata TaxID=50429 RepID=A0A2B4RMZ1_STYPI|nr:interferon alpha-inducible protein 27-like protein 1 [Stylophora pistillata]PFX17698.1 Interferon alpha-inducible protein 6 [Stylophora pistillata]
MINRANFCILLFLTCLSPVKAEDSDKGGWCWGEYVTAGVIGGVAAMIAAPFLLPAAGFTTAGVAAGSVAAGIQSAVYGGTVTAGSVFATLQSAGAAGLGVTTSAAVGSFGAGLATYVKNKLAPCEQESKCSSDQE